MILSKLKLLAAVGPDSGGDTATRRRLPSVAATAAPLLAPERTR